MGPRSPRSARRGALDLLPTDRVGYIPSPVSLAQRQAVELDCDVVVVANHHRSPLVLADLVEVPHRVSLTPDAELPAGFRARHPYGDYNPLGAYRCFVGHQQALATGIGRPLLVLEDDAVAVATDWLDLVRLSLPLLARFEVVSLHGRDFDRSRMESIGMLAGRRLWAPRLDPLADVCRVLGSLAYLIDAAAAERFCSLRYDGLPVDLLLASRFRFALLDPSPFAHDRRQGSLIG